MSRRERRAQAAQERRTRGTHKIYPDGSFVYREGLPLLVIRPKDPKLALGHARYAELTNDAERFDEMLTYQSGYTFREYLRAEARPGLPAMHVSDQHGVFLEELQPGDSFVLEKAIAKAEEKRAPDLKLTTHT